MRSEIFTVIIPRLFLCFIRGDSPYPPSKKRYHILKVLGRGAFGQVFQCWDEKNERTVAIKVLKLQESSTFCGPDEVSILTLVRVSKDPNFPPIF